MNADITKRVRKLMHDTGFDQKHLAEACGLTKFTINRYMNDKKNWSDNSLLKISKTFGVKFLWLRDGIGEMLEDIKIENIARQEAVERNFDNITAWRTEKENRNGERVNDDTDTMHGDSNMGRHTNDMREREILLQKITLLEKMVEDKDKEISFLRGMLEKGKLA